MRTVPLILALLLTASCGRRQSTGETPVVGGAPRIEPTPAPNNIWNRIEEMYPLNQLVDGKGNLGVAVIHREREHCHARRHTCRTSTLELYREKNPAKYRPGDYIYEVLPLSLDGRPNMTELVRDCLNKQVQEIARLDEIAPELRGVYKVLSLDSFQVYQRPYQVLSRYPVRSDVGESKVSLDVTWRSKGQELNGRNVIVISGVLVINEDEPEKCSIINAQRIYRRLVNSRTFPAGESALY